MHPVFRIPPDTEYPAPFISPRVSVQGLMDTVSNFGVDWARMQGAFITPIAIGASRAAKPAAVSAVFLANDSIGTLRLVIIASILFLSLDPVTPATHASG